MLNTESQSSPIITKAVLRKRLYAFAVTGLTVFVLACLVWPLTVTGFRSVAAVNVSGDMNDSAVEIHKEFARLIRDESSNERLDVIISQIESTEIQRSKRIEYRDYDWIRSALKVGLKEQPSGCQFQLAFDGDGGPDERELVNLLALRIAQRFRGDQQLGMDQVASGWAPSGGTGAMDDSAESLQSAQLRSFDQANWILQQIDNDLETIRTPTTAAALSPTRLPSTSGQLSGGDNGSSFQLASSSKVVPATDEQLQTAIDSIDTRSLRSVLNEIEDRIRNQQVQVDLNPPESVTDNGSAAFNVQSLDRSRTVPVNGSPGLGSLIMLGLFSVAIGCAVARCYDPFEARGFPTVDTLGKMLGVPVVVELKSGTDSLDGQGADSIGASWSNRIVKIAGLTLLGVFMVVIGFVLTNSGVRAAFVENPLYGCARIFRIFAGY
jgi:hypothetical protein